MGGGGVQVVTTRVHAAMPGAGMMIRRWIYLVSAHGVLVEDPSKVLMRQRLVFHRLYFGGPVVPKHVEACRNMSKHANADMF